MTTPNIETAALIREYAQWLLDECGHTPLLAAIVNTDASSAEGCCHMGRALIALTDGLSDPPYRVGGAMCDPRVTEIARRLSSR